VYTDLWRDVENVIRISAWRERRTQCGSSTGFLYHALTLDTIAAYSFKNLGMTTMTWRTTTRFRNVFFVFCWCLMPIKWVIRTAPSDFQHTHRNHSCHKMTLTMASGINIYSFSIYPKQLFRISQINISDIQNILDIQINWKHQFYFGYSKYLFEIYRIRILDITEKKTFISDIQNNVMALFVTFGTARRGLGGAAASVPTSYYSMWHYNYLCPLKG